MISAVMLDATPLGKLAHPSRKPDIDSWFRGLLAAGVQVIIPEITDYEVRRSLLLGGLARSVAALDQLRQLVTYAPLTTPAMRRAAELWADARRQGQPTADPKELDGDVILAA